VHRRQQYYGDTYFHTTHDCARLQPAEKDAGAQRYEFTELEWIVDKLFEPQYRHLAIFKADHSNYPNQVLVNEYIGNQGIGPHYDDSEAFGDVIATVSLCGPTYLWLTLPAEPTNRCKQVTKKTGVLLEPGSLMVMKGDCRYLWRHGIANRPKTQKLRDGISTFYRGNDYRRLSLTIRKLLDGRKFIKDPHPNLQISDSPDTDTPSCVGPDADALTCAESEPMQTCESRTEGSEDTETAEHPGMLR
jgi:alkylated DNA repair dioxygenase AlkB